MLSILGFQTAQLPFGKKGHAEHQKLHSSRSKPMQTQSRPMQPGATYYVLSSSGSYVFDLQRTAHGHAGHSLTTVTPGFSQPAAPQYAPGSSTISKPEYRTSTSTQLVMSSGDRSNTKSDPPGKTFKIYPDTPMLDSFVYERSEVADSDTFTVYSNSSVDTLMQFPATERTTQVSPPSGNRRNSIMPGAGASDAKGFSAVQTAPDSPHPLPLSLPSSSSSVALVPQERPVSRSNEDRPRPRSGSNDSVTNSRRGSGESERPVAGPPVPSPTRSSPPRNIANGRFPERPSVPPNLTSGPRDIQPVRRDSDPFTQAETTRKRRLSGAVIPTGFGVLPGERLSPNGRDTSSVVPAGLGSSDRQSPPILRAAPAPDGKRERYSPDREVSPTVGFTRDRRTSGAGANGYPAPPPGSFYDRDRPPLRRGSQSSSSSHERHSPQDDAPRGVSFAPGPVPIIRSRTISQGRINKGDAPKQIFVAGLETAKMVRFSENLICPSPIPVERRRRGWFNKRGDQLWTNDGVFVAADPGTEYPIDLVDYPDPGAGWQNEEGVRIDMQHRLIPKTPLRPALKRGGSSAVSQSQQQLQQSIPARPENRSIPSSTSIRQQA